MNPAVSIVILNWNGKRYLKDLFTCLSKQTYPKDKIEVIMVDNNSKKDNSVAFVEKNFPWVRIIKNKENYGFAKGSNIGMLASKGEYIVLLNNDTKPQPRWLEELVRVAKEKNAGAVVPKLMFDKRRKYINNAGGFLQYDKTWPVIERGINEKDTGQYNKIVEITAFCGASVLLKRAMLDDIGLLDESLWMYFEDTDLSWRGQKKGWKYFFAPESIVYHVHAGSSGESTPMFIFQVSRNRQLVLFKNAYPHIILKGFMATLRDRIWRELCRLVASFINRTNRKDAAKNLWLGIKVVASCFRLLPVMLLKRWGLVKERSFNS